MKTLVRIIGLAILVGGIIVFSFGINSSNSIVDRGVQSLTNQYTGNRMWYIIGGLVMIFGGGALAANAKKFIRRD